MNRDKRRNNEFGWKLYSTTLLLSNSPSFEGTQSLTTDSRQKVKTCVTGCVNSPLSSTVSIKWVKIIAGESFSAFELRPLLRMKRRWVKLKLLLSMMCYSHVLPEISSLLEHLKSFKPVCMEWFKGILLKRSPMHSCILFITTGTRWALKACTRAYTIFTHTMQHAFGWNLCTYQLQDSWSPRRFWAMLYDQNVKKVMK